MYVKSRKRLAPRYEDSATLPCKLKPLFDSVVSLNNEFRWYETEQRGNVCSEDFETWLCDRRRVCPKHVVFLRILRLRITLSHT